MFAVLGEILFDTLSAPEHIGSEYSWNFAEHRVVEDTPRLQWIGNELETITLEMTFHASFTNPTAQLAALLLAASDHQARPLVFGNGVFRGYFVITALSTIDRQMSDWGDSVAVRVRVELKEWNPGVVNPNALPLATFAAVAVTAAPGGGTTAALNYLGALGVSATVGSGASPYVAPSLSAAGVSPMLGSPNPSGPGSAALTAADVAPSVIVRAAN
jgi:phage protein U